MGHHPVYARSSDPMHILVNSPIEEREHAAAHHRLVRQAHMAWTTQTARPTLTPRHLARRLWRVPRRAFLTALLAHSGEGGCAPRLGIALLMIPIACYIWGVESPPSLSAQCKPTAARCALVLHNSSPWPQQVERASMMADGRPARFSGDAIIGPFGTSMLVLADQHGAALHAVRRVTFLAGTLPGPVTREAVDPQLQG